MFSVSTEMKTMPLFSSLHKIAFILCLLPVFGFVECVSKTTLERVVTDLELVNGVNGVALDFTYNETSYVKEQLASAPGCPKSIDGYPWIYSASSSSSSQFVKPTLRCYLAGSQGPCPNAQVLLILSGSKWGVCACECLLRFQESWTPVPTQGNGRIQTCRSGNIQQIYDALDKTSCYNVNEQGPCPEGKVVVAAATSSSQNLTSRTGFSVACLPPCDVTENNWSSQNLNGNCSSQLPPPFGAAPSVLRHNDCPEDEKYSNLLRKCVKRQANKSLVIG